MSHEMASILAQPDTQDYLVKQGSEAFISTPAEVTALIKADVAKYSKIIKDAGIKID
jgi:tripartite-type tricarboxylate transporter receptor subunit TctC